MVTINIRDVEINFPFEPYDIQKVYMSKVIECLQTCENGVLESPTGTGKTLSLLCASLGWLTMKKAQIQVQRQAALRIHDGEDFMSSLKNELDPNVGMNKVFHGTPRIIYASRTHSQLTQAMQELKRSSYRHMKSVIAGSREQMCVHPDVMKEPSNSVKIHLCRTKVKERSCQFYNRVESKKSHPCIKDQPILDIEDLITMGKKQGFCPYYMSKELKHEADIIFMPYNYILDHRSRKALGIELTNNIIILDEAHNIEKICEDSASIEIKSTDITLCIAEVTDVMKCLADDMTIQDEDTPKDFSAEELCVLKETLLKFEKAVDAIEIKRSGDLTSFNGNYIFQILDKADINDSTANFLIASVEKIISFMSTRKESGLFQRKGNGLQLFEDLLRIVFSSTTPDFKEKLNKCYKVIMCEETSKSFGGGWMSKGPTASYKLLKFLCFSPGFGMNMLKQEGIICVILTSGTLAPLPPLISELELDVKVHLENPHIIKADQICVKILTQGPDKEVLSSSYKNRDNANYLRSLGSTIVNVCRFVPHGLLIFFPSYPLLQKCQEKWQQLGIWSSITKQKPIFVEPKQKDDFHIAMNDYYAKIKDKSFNGAIFMGVCRGKISEGLDFADANGRAVIIIGLPYPPMKDPKIVLKKNYLNECNSRDKRYLIGDDWYSLEAMRAVNQAIGRVIRHKDDYGAILLLDTRFNNPKLKSQLSLWLRDHIKVIGNFGQIIMDLKAFFKNAETKFAGLEKQIPDVKQEIKECEDILERKGLFAYSTSSSDSSLTNKNHVQQTYKRRKIRIVQQAKTSPDVQDNQQSEKEIIMMMQKKLKPDEYKTFIGTMQNYKDSSDFNVLQNGLDVIFLNKPSERYLIQFLFPYIREIHRKDFEFYWDKMK